MTLPAAIPSPRRPKGSLKAFLAGLPFGHPVEVPTEADAKSLNTCAWQSGLRGSYRQPSPGARERIFTIVGPLKP